MLLGSLLAGLVVLAWAFIRLGRRAAAAELTRAGAFLRYLGWGFLPPGVTVGVFLLLIGAEELTGAAIIAEGLARSLPLLVGFQVALALLGALAFGVRLAFLPRARPE